jgi:hypothetical protein
MWSLLKFIIWIAGVLVVVYFILGYFGYEPNFNYLQESKAKCREKAAKCGQELVEQGTKNAKCYSVWDCIELKLIIKKKAN